MKILKENCYKDAPMYMRTGDTLSINYTNEEGKTTLLDSIDFQKSQKIDRVVIAEITNEYGFVTGLCGIVGEAL
jgi:endonuclease YncB( thermonuclease family)